MYSKTFHWNILIFGEDERTFFERTSEIRFLWGDNLLSHINQNRERLNLIVIWQNTSIVLWKITISRVTINCWPKTCHHSQQILTCLKALLRPKGFPALLYANEAHSWWGQILNWGQSGTSNKTNEASGQTFWQLLRGDFVQFRRILLLHLNV